MQSFATGTFQRKLLPSCLRKEVKQYSKHNAVITAGQRVGSYSSNHYSSTERYNAKRWNGETGRISVLHRHKNEGDPGWQQMQIQRSNSSLEELAEGLRLNSYFFLRRVTITVQNIFSRNLPALAFFNTLRNVRMYDSSDPFQTNVMSVVDDPKSTDERIHCQLWRD